tara:strand:+ start:856 stop:1224 length:369 start_codon:yes stop_codon:yes gene_type:complete
MPTKIKFQNKINESVSIGDFLYVVIPSSNVSGLAGNSPNRGANSVITEVGEDFVTIAGNARLVSPATVDHFYYARKPVHNNTSLKGYVLQARLNCDVSAFDSYVNSNKKLFSLGSEVTQSSK